MRFSELFNFKELSDQLCEHPWVEDPCVAVRGQRHTGKTRVIENFAGNLHAKSDYVLLFDAKEVCTRLQILEQAMNVAEPEELSRSRARLNPQGVTLAVSNSNLVNSRLSVTSRMRWAPFFRRRSDGPSPEPDGADMIPILLDDFERLDRPGWVIVDHLNMATPEIRYFVQMVERKLRVSSKLRLVVVENLKAGQAVPVSSGVQSSVTFYATRLLEVADVQEWATALGLQVSHDHAEMLHSVTGGHAGKLWENLAILQIKPQWRLGTSREGGK